MKKTLTILLIHISAFSFAQVSFGVRAGLNLSNIAHNGSFDGVFTETKSKLDFHAGVYTQISLSERFSFIPELLYTKRGFRIEESLFAPDTRYNVNYLELPIIISYAPLPWAGIDLGPSVAYQLSAFAKSDDGKDDIGSAFDKKLDVGINAGLRVKVNEKFAVVFRYYYGLAAILTVETRDENNMPTGELKYFNRSAQLGVSYGLK